MFSLSVCEWTNRECGVCEEQNIIYPERNGILLFAGKWSKMNQIQKEKYQQHSYAI